MNEPRARFPVLGSQFVFTFVLATVMSNVDLVGQVLSDAPASRVRNDPAYVAQGAPGGNRETGQTMYAKAGCEGCHGPNGQGTAAGPRLAGTTRQMSAFIAYIRKPTGGMPAQSAQMVSDQILADIYTFLRAASVGRVPNPPGSRAQKEPAYENAGRADVGATLYGKVGCYQCHANQAQGGLAGPRLGPDPIPFARFSQYIRNPTGDMPPYTDKVLSNQDLADIYAFIQARPRPPAVNTIPQLTP